mgnify:CR=1 FL=1
MDLLGVGHLATCCDLPGQSDVSLARFLLVPEAGLLDSWHLGGQEAWRLEEEVEG